MTTIVFQGEVEVLAAAWSLSSGRTVELRLVAEGATHPFKAHTKRRGNKAGTRFKLGFAEIGGLQQEMLIEAMLADWKESPKGQTVKFFLPPDGALHPFEWCAAPSAGQPGTRLMLATTELSDDEEEVDQAAREKVEAIHVKEAKERKPRAPRKLSAQAHLMVTGDLFLSWLLNTRPKQPQGGWTADAARAWVKHQLKLDSLSDLDTRPEKAEEFHDRIRKPFAEWCERG